jgi:hypothetical protein
VRTHRLAELATKLLRHHRGAGSDHLGDRARTIAALERALANRNRRRWPLPVAVAGAAAAAAAIALFGLRVMAPSAPGVTAQMVSTEPPWFVRDGLRGEYQAGQPVLQGDRLHTKAATQLALSTGTTIAVAPTSDLDVVELGERQRLSLSGGHLHARVKKLLPQQTFSVTTPDALVSVRGTEFDVDVGPDPACGGRTATRVRVFEGVVVVQHAGAETQLIPTHTWSTPCQHEATTAPAPAVAPVPAARLPARSAVAPRRSGIAPAMPPAVPRASATTTTTTTTTDSTLTEQNDLLEQAIVARRRGDRTTALRRLDDLLARFPNGPLAAAATRVRRELATGP